VSAAGISARVSEGRNLWRALQSEHAPKSTGGVTVSGMLAAELARELGAGADPGAVTAGAAPRVAGADVAVHVIAGVPSDEDTAFVRTSDAAGFPVVLVQLWPQAEWTLPFVLSPFVVECRAGEGFPVREIADRIAEGAESASALAARVPVLQEAVTADVVRGAIFRAVLLAATGARRRSSRPLIALEQARMISRLRTIDPRPTLPGGSHAVVGGAALVYAAGFACRGAARAARRMLPAPVVDATFAAAGTWALAKALQQIEARSPSP